MQGDWTLPFGRGQRFGGNVNNVVNALVGGWSFSAVGRIQTVMQDFGNVRLVGMSKSELQDMYKYYVRPNAATNIDEVWMLPEDVILNTRRAFSTSNTTVDGYSASLGAPDGQVHRAGELGLLHPGQGGRLRAAQRLLLAPWFKRFDIGAHQALRRRRLEEHRGAVRRAERVRHAELQPGRQSGHAAQTIFRTTSAYTDASNTYDPGGRIGQLMFRFTW